MNIEEIRKAKRELSQDIAARIQKFNKDTGVSISSIDINMIEVSNPRGDVESVVGLIDIRLNL